ncbi:hypothetical protein [Ferrimonas sp.]|uniref:hypothetical protein n=1 Tax=Ferrimonas sp. TaxID=2080861 RepID=UPI003A923902
MRFFLLFGLLITSALPLCHSTEFNGPLKVYIEGDQLYYDGELTQQGLNTILRVSTNAEEPLRWLVVRSGGGEIGVSMDIANWILDRKLNIKVVDGCMSSCANYLFAAGNKKVIEPGAVVAWHGSAIQKAFEFAQAIEKALADITDPDEKARMRKISWEKTNSYMNAMKAKQASFFDRAGVDPMVTIIGQEPEYRVENFWALSVKDMAHYGLNDVEAAANYPSTDLSRFREMGRAVEFIKLNHTQ